MRNIGIEYPARGEMAFYDLEAPRELTPTEVLIRTRYSGITNGTERHALMAEHGWTNFPGRHGYQHVGTIEAAGSEVQGFTEGDWVFFGRYVGHRGWHIQEVSSADARSNGSHLCLPLPEGLDRRECALLGVAGVAMRGARRCRVGAADNVWVAGVGPIGQFAAQAARCLGAHVTVTDLNPRRLEVVRELGAHRVLDASADTVEEELVGAGPFDRVIDGCGVESLFRDLRRLGLLARGGAVCALAVRSDAVFPWSLLHGLEASIEVSCHFSLDDLRVVTHFLQQGLLRIAPLISHSVPIDDAPAIYETMRDRPGDLLGAVFDWSE